MRAFPRLLASVKATKFLEPYAPTGLTGLFTHPAPRSALLYLYHSTLDKLQAFPESSAYRQSAEAVTRQRLNMVEQIKPAGYDAWLERSRKEIEENTKLYEESSGDSEDGQAGSLAVRRGGNVFVAVETDHRDPHTLEWDGEPDLGPALEGTRTEEEKEADQSRVAAFKAGPKPRQQRFDWEPEPQLDADQCVGLFLIMINTLLIREN